jgi:hypothetical protein
VNDPTGSAGPSPRGVMESPLPINEAERLLKELKKALKG